MLVAARLRLRVSPALLRLLCLPATLLGSVGLALPALEVLSGAFAGSAPPRFPLGGAFALSERPSGPAEPGEAACHYDASAKFWADSHREQALVIFVAM